MLAVVSGEKQPTVGLSEGGAAQILTALSNLNRNG
jgi:hypothetical protein